jgi:hypothetical protein
MEFVQSVCIDNVVVSTTSTGLIHVSTIELMRRKGVDCTNIQRVMFGSRASDNKVISSIIERRMTIEDAINTGVRR